MLKNKKQFLLFLFLFSFFFAPAQETKTGISLKIILSQISQQHDVFFNYLEDEIIIFTLTEPNREWTLDEKINYIKKETKLNFSLINGKYYNIYNDKKLDKPLCGFLINKETNTPLANATISISNTTISTVSQDNGFFELPIVSSNKIEISHLGFTPMLISPETLYVTNCPKIFLTPFIIPLDEVITQSFLTSGISKKNDGTIIIKPQKIGHLPGLTEPDVFKTLQQIPGILSVDETISNINVRGGTHDQNLVLWNGIRLFQTGHFFGLLSALNPNLAHTVKVIKNGSSALYGESTSGIIDISTHTETIEKGKGAVGMNMINGDFYTKFKTSEKSNIEISGRRSYTDFLETPTYTNYSNRIFQNTQITNTSNNKDINYKSKEKFYFYDFTAQLHQKIGKKTDLFIDGILISNQLDVKQSTVENSVTISKNSFLKQNTLGGSICLKNQWSTKNTLEMNTYASSYKIFSENESIESNQIFNQENDILDTGVKIHNTFQISDQYSLKSGYQYNEIGVRNIDKINSPLFSRKIKEVLRNHALFIESNYTSKPETFKATVGIRGNYFEQLAVTLIEPRIQLNYSFNQNLSVEILAESKNQTTSQIIDLQQDFLGIEKRRWILSNNKDIPIMKSHQVSFGFTFKKNKWLLILDNYLKKVNGITSKSQGFQNQLEFLNLNGSYTILGSEILIQKQIRNFTTWVSYTHTNNDYDFKNFSPNVFPNNFEIKHNLNFAAIYEIKSLKLALGTKWHSGKPITLPASQTLDPANPKIEYQTPNSSNLEDYFQLNFSGSYLFTFKENSKLQVGFSIENILNSKNTVNQYYRVNQNTKTIEKVNTFSLERTPNAFLRYTF